MGRRMCSCPNICDTGIRRGRWVQPADAGCLVPGPNRLACIARRRRTPLLPPPASSAPRHTRRTTPPTNRQSSRCPVWFTQIHYEGGGSQTEATDVICPMYARVHQIKRLAADPADRRPVILCEYAHAMGNSSGNVHAYWEAFDTVPGLQVGVEGGRGGEEEGTEAWAL